MVGDRITDERHKDTIEELAPGDHAPYSLSVPRRLLHADTPGVYWFGVHALGERPEGRDLAADGRARTFLPLVPPARDGQQPTAVVIPLRHQLVYTDDGLARRPRELDPDPLPGRSAPLAGRLRGHLRRPHGDLGRRPGARRRRTPARGRQPAPSLAPNLQAGQDDGEDEASADPSASATPTEEPTATPTERAAGVRESSAAGSPLDLDELDPVVQAAAQAAQAWLARLGEAMRPEDQVMSLPYGDVDVAAAAEHDPQLYERAVARAGTTLPGFDVTTTPVLSSPSGYLTAQAIRGADRARRSCSPTRCSRPRPPPVAEHRGPQRGRHLDRRRRGRPGPGQHDVDHRDAAAAAVRGRGAVPPRRPGAADHGAPARLEPLGRQRCVLLRPRRGLARPHLGAGGEPGGRTRPRWTARPCTTRSGRRPPSSTQPNFDAADELIRSGVALQNLLTLNNIVAGAVTDQALGTVSYSARTRPIENRASADASRAWIENRLGAGARRGAARGHPLQLERPVPGDGHQRPRPAGDGHASTPGRTTELTIDGPATIEVAAEPPGRPCCSTRAPTRTASTR